MIEKHAAIIEKYEILKKEIERFPSVFIEGAACCGKTTMVRQYLNHIEAAVDEDPVCMIQSDKAITCFDKMPFRKMKDFSPQLNSGRNQYQWTYRTLTWGMADFDTFLEECLQWICSSAENHGRILILIYRMNSEQMQEAEEHVRKICEAIHLMPGPNKIIIESREKPFRAILDLIWHGEMGMISQQKLSLTDEELRVLLKERGSALSVSEVMKLTGGWSGCVQMLVTVEKTYDIQTKRMRPEDMMLTYEICSFIWGEILSTLTQDEQDIVSLIRQCGWATEEMLRVFLTPSFTGRSAPVSGLREVTENLIRKGILFRYGSSDKFHVRKMFCSVYQLYGDSALHFPENMLAFWYEEQGYLQEAANLFWNMPAAEFHAFLVREYMHVPFLKINLSCLSDIKIDSSVENPDIESELIYLCGIAALRNRDLLRFQDCSDELNRRNGFREAEMLVNLAFADVHCATNDWYSLLERKSEPGKRFHLFHAKKNLYSCLYSVRELSDHFACLRREQNRYERMWKNYFGPEESVFFAFARAEYLAETFQEEKITADYRELLLEQTEQHPDQFLPVLFKIRALCRNQNKLFLSDERIQVLLEGCTPDTSSYQTVQLLQVIFTEQTERDFDRVRYLSENYNTIIRQNPSDFHYNLFLLAKALIMVRQYSKADRVLHLLDPVLDRLPFTRLQAEALFLSALVHQSQGRKVLAAQEVVESFALAEPYRYAVFYTQYGEAGRQLMTGYMDWMKKNPSYKNHKKRYQYANLLNVPQDEFVEILIRKCRKQELAEVKNRISSPNLSVTTHEKTVWKEEHLTMTELILLQDLRQGLSNQDICRKENLKLPTVKSHLYNIYRKLGVKNRGQAVRTAIEQDIVKI